MKILLGTRNEGKIKEFLNILDDLRDVEFLTKRDIKFPEIEEDGSSYRENALKKARGISKTTGYPVLSEDAGLEVRYLEGSPGIYSSRFAGENASPEDNNRKLLSLLKGKEGKERRARFVSCVLLYIPDRDEVRISQGVLSGEIATEKRGNKGFGYDPLFIPDGFSKTLAQLGSEVKDSISHRKEALEGIKGEIEELVQLSK